jgi:uncharacterized membrane protein
MNRHEFIAELKKKLRKLPFDEIKEAVDYYEQYFDDAGDENEQAVLEELGSPSRVASQITATFAVNKADTEKSGKKGLHLVWFVILALFAAPIAVPIALSAGVVAISLIMTLLSVLLSFFIAGAAFALGGLASAIAGFLVIYQSVPTALFFFFFGLVSLGIGAAIVIATTKLSKRCFRWLTKKIGNFVLRRKEK